jgi:hypothetical protein
MSFNFSSNGSSSVPLSVYPGCSDNITVRKSKFTIPALEISVELSLENGTVFLGKHSLALLLSVDPAAFIP